MGEREELKQRALETISYGEPDGEILRDLLAAIERYEGLLKKAHDAMHIYAKQGEVRKEIEEALK